MTESTEIMASPIRARLPMPKDIGDMDARKWRVLCESVFPNAKTSEAIVMALDYCKARKLDPFKRPVNIVPMWNKTLKKNVETVWPSINEVQVTASRTGKYAGMDEPKWGELKTKIFEGKVKGYNEDGEWQDNVAMKLEVTYPEWCSVTVYRLVDGQRCAFTEPVFWEEAYARIGKSDIPNAMWAKRARGQLLKVAKAFSLRAAFPEEGEYVAEEMEGREIHSGGVVIEQDDITATTGTLSAKQAYGSVKLMKAKWSEIAAHINSCNTDEELDRVSKDYRVDFANFKAIDEVLFDNLCQLGQSRRETIREQDSERELDKQLDDKIGE